MWDLVRNPEDRFSHNEAQLPQLGKRELFCSIDVSSPGLVTVVCARIGGLFLLVLRKGCVISLPESSGSQGKLIVYHALAPVRPSLRRPFTFFKDLLRNRVASQSHRFEASMGRGNESPGHVI